LFQVRDHSSTEEEIQQGDWILAQACSTPRDGDTIAVLVDGKPTVKKFYREDEERVGLQSADEKLKVTIANADPVKILGRVVAVIRKY